MSENKRETLGSRIGFIFLSAGCAIGLGNVWRFPFITGQYGGAAFVVIYIAFLLLLAMPILVMELAVGRASRQSVATSFNTLCPRHKAWGVWGYFGWLGCILLMSFYTVVTGWMIAYTFSSLFGLLEGMTPDEVGGAFGALLSNPREMTSWLLLAVMACATICGLGLRDGVERVTKFMMCGLLVFMLVLACRAMTLPGAEAGLEFYLKPDFGKLVESGLATSVYAALAQAFFTLGLGVGSMAIFGSYIGRDRSLMSESLLITALDTFVAICSGLIIFPACFAYGVHPGAGPGLIFVTLPNMFNQMPGARLWSTLFFLFMSFAALSTVVAVFENIIACFMDKFSWSRKHASIMTGIMMFLLSMPCLLGFNLWSGFQPLGPGSGVLDLEDFILSNNLLPIGALVYLLFCVTRYGWGWDNFTAEVDAGKGLKFPKMLRGYCTYFVPLVIIGIFIVGYYQTFNK